MPKIRVLRSPEEVFAVVGGLVGYGRLTGRSKQLCNYYKNKGSLPAADILVVQDALKKHRCAAAVTVFGIRDPQRAA